MTLLLCWEYSFLKKQSYKLKKIKQEYQHHIGTLKNMAYTHIYTQQGEKRPRFAYAFSSMPPDSAPAMQSIFIPIDKAFYYLNQANMAYIKTYAYMQPSCLVDVELEQTCPAEQSYEEYDTIIEMHKPFIWPIDRSKFWLSSVFGMRKEPNGKHRFHYGIDMAAAKKTQVRAAASGIIDQVYEDPLGYGKTIVIKHDDTYKTRYAHLDSILVKSGQQVHAGMLIGRVGDTGNVRKKGRDASHLHFEVYELGKRVNPLYFLS